MWQNWKKWKAVARLIVGGLACFVFGGFVLTQGKDAGIHWALSLPAFLAGVLTLGIGVWIGWGNEIATALDRRRAPDAGKTHERQKTPSAWAGPLRGPAAVMCGAVFASLLALALGKFAPDFLVPLRVVLIVGALVAAGMVVWWRLCDLGEQTFEA